MAKTQTRNLAWGCDGVLEDGKQCPVRTDRHEDEKAPGGWIEVYARVVPQDPKAAAEQKKKRTTQKVFHSKQCLMRYFDNRFKDPQPSEGGPPQDLPMPPSDAQPIGSVPAPAPHPGQRQ